MIVLFNNSFKNYVWEAESNVFAFQPQQSGFQNEPVDFQKI